jgi:HlyD family secretion protein
MKLGKKLRRIVIGAAVGFVALVALFFALRTSPVPVEIAEVSRQTVREFIAEDGTTRLKETYIIDMPVSGTIERITLDEGDRVQAGETLARVDAFDLEQRIRAIEAGIRQAEAQTVGVDEQKTKPETIESAQLRIQESSANLAIARQERSIAEINFEDAEREYNRMKTLRAGDVISQSEFDRVERQFNTARENLERAKLGVDLAARSAAIAEKEAERVVGSVDDNEYMREFYAAEKQRYLAELDQAREDLKKSDIQAPIDGVVLEKFVEDRRVMAAGTQLLTIGDPASIEIETDILSEEVVRIDEGDPVEIMGKALGDGTVIGTVKRIYPRGFKKISSLGIEQQRVKVLIAFDNSGLNLLPGTSVDIRVITESRENVLAVPERSTFRQANRWYVFLYRGGEARLQEVELGIKNDDWAEIIAGLEEGDAVIAEPRNDIADGTPVTAE